MSALVKSILLVALLLSYPGAVASRVAQVELQRLARGAGTEGVAVTIDDAGILTVVSSRETPQTVPLLVLSEPELRTENHAIRGLVSHDGVVGESYLEMWTSYGGDERYFTRTLARAGSMKKIMGSSDWRPFSLPFTGNGRKEPIAIELNLIFGGPGTVCLRGVGLVEFSGSEDPLRLASAWWGPKIAGVFAGLVGGVIGVLGGVIGWLTGKGKARGAVLKTTRILSIVGVVVLCIGALAFLTGQPVEVVFPLALVGGLTAFVFGTSRKSILISYELKEDPQAMSGGVSPDVLNPD